MMAKRKSGAQKTTGVEEIVSELEKDIPHRLVAMEDLLSTGSTLLNLACTGRKEGGFVKGHYFFLVGDSQSGKTFLGMTLFAEASINKHFDKYAFVFDDVEGGAQMNIEEYFGRKVAERMRPPSRGNSVTIEGFYFNLDDELNQGPCIYVLDSMDGLTSEYELKKFSERKDAADKGTEARGDYGDGKAKINASSIRGRLSKLRDTDSILVVINQTRDNIGATFFEPKKTRSGGHALSFYAQVEAWSSVGSQIRKEVRGNKLQEGMVARVQVKRSRFTGKVRTVDVPILNKVGIDDVSGNIEYLLKTGAWKKNKAGVISTGLESFGDGRKNTLVAKIEEDRANGGTLETELQALVEATWCEIESSCSEGRSSKYS